MLSIAIVHKITIEPFINATLGSDVKIRCPVPFVHRWYFVRAGDSRTPTTPAVSDYSNFSIIIIENVNINHTGRYYCFGKLKKNKRRYYMSDIELQLIQLTREYI